jgi:hypothetical protein
MGSHELKEDQCSNKVDSIRRIPKIQSKHTQMDKSHVVNTDTLKCGSAQMIQ